jgi:hypothetical protein
MIIYKDAFTGDEMYSDSFPVTEIDDCLYEVEGKFITLSEGGYDIGCSGDVPEEELALAEGARSVINIVDAFRLQETTFDKKAYMAYIKGYMKRVKSHLEITCPERVSIFMEKAQSAVKKILGQFKEWQFFTGETMDPEAMILLMGFREDGMTPFFWAFKDGLKPEKV